MKIIFEGIPPSKKNSKTMVCRWRRPMLIPSKAYTKWHKEQKEKLWDTKSLWEAWHLKFTYKFFIPYKKEWWISKRPFDFSNKIESINDFLVDIWVITDDNYTIISEQHIYSEYVPFWEWKVEVLIEDAIFD